jgi:membrane-bound inhibitor of C-type lysozyme
MARTCICIVCALAFGLPACAHRNQAKTAHPTAGPLPDKEITPRDAFTCASGQNLATQFNPAQQELALSIDNTLLRLEQVPSGSGTKFSNGEVVFWNKGNDASLEIAGVTTECQRVATGPQSY